MDFKREIEYGRFLVNQHTLDSKKIIDAIHTGTLSNRYFKVRETDNRTYYDG